MRIYNRGFRAESATGAPIPGAHVTLWDAQTGGSQITTGIQDLTGGAIAGGVLVCDSWGYAPSFQDTLDRANLWAIGADTGTIDGVQRIHLEPDNTDDRVTALEAAVGGVTASLLYAYDYGYRADGNPASAANNTTALQNAINDAATKQARVILPPGYGYITAPGLELKSRVWIQGAGHYATVLQLADNANCHMIRNHISTDGTSDPNAMFCGVLDLALDGRGAHQSSAGPYRGISFDTNPAGTIGGADLAMDATHLIQNVYVRNTHDDGIYINGRSDTRIIGCKVSNAGGNAYRLGFDTHVDACIAEKPSLAGFLVTGSATQLTNCKAYICGQSATSVNGQPGVPSSGHGYVVTGVGIGEITFAGCDAQQVSGHGFHITGGANGATIAGCTVQEASYSNGTSFVSFNVDNATNCVVSGTSKTDNNVSSLRLVNGADLCDVRVSHSLVAGQTTLAAALSADSVLLGNRVHCNGAPYSPAARTWAPSTSYAVGQLISYLGFVYQVTTAFTSGATFNLANKTLISAPLQGNPIPAGQFVFPAGGQSPATSATLGVGTLRAYPFYLPHAMTLTGLGAEVTTGTVGDAGSKVRLGIYADTGNLTPGALVLDAGQIAGDSATVQTLTTSQVLNPGVYWLAAVVQAVTTTQPTVRTFTPTGLALPMSSAPAAGANLAGWTHATTPITGALPATFTLGGPIASVARIHVKG